MKSSETKWDQMTSIKLSKTKWNQVKASETKWNQVKPSETKSSAFSCLRQLPR